MLRQVCKGDGRLNHRCLVIWVFLLLTLTQGTALSSRGIDDSWYSRNTTGSTKCSFVMETSKRANTIGDYPTILWNRTYGGGEADYAATVIQATNGGFIFIGSTRSSGKGDFDVWLVKTDSQGNMEWQQTYGGAEYDEGNSVIETSDGGFALVGSTRSSGAGDFDAWLVKTNGQGNIQWQQTYGGSHGDGASVVLETSDGGFILGGSTRSYGAGETDVRLIKTDPNGAVEWTQTYGGPEIDVIRSLIKTPDGFALIGYTSSYGAGGWDVWLVKTDEKGAIQWNQTYGNSEDDAAWAGIQIATGYILVGYTHSYGMGFRDFWLIQTDSQGIPQFNQTYGDFEFDEAWAIIEMGDGFMIAGSTWSFGAGNGDVWVIQINLLGEVEWQQTYGGPENDEARAIIKTIDENFVLAGYTTSYGAGDRDAWLIQIGSPVTSTVSHPKTSDTDGEPTPGFEAAPVLLTIPIVLWIQRRRRR